MANEINGKTILLGVTGCIAAYKSCEILRGLQKAGADVKVVMTEHATEFVGPTTFRALTNHEVAVGLFDSASDPIHHISLAKEADLMLIAPATANTLVKIAYGIADNLLTTTALATTAQIIVAPAMNTQMWKNPKVQKAISMLETSGVIVVTPDTGRLACGDTGEGKLAPVDTIVDITLSSFHDTSSLEGKTVMITSGPTYEPIDPVRFIGNWSSGLTGTLIASEAAKRGAKVVLVSGPTSLPDPRNVETIHVETAAQMLEASARAFEACDAAVFCAAVADFRPKAVSKTKIKKQPLGSLATDADAIENSAAGSGAAAGTAGTNFTNDQETELTIELVRNPDILQTLAQNKGARFVVGFAAETGDAISYAKSKLHSKNADLIVANDVSDPALGFGTANNRVWLVSRDAVVDSGLVSKSEEARLVVDRIAEAIVG